MPSDPHSKVLRTRRIRDLAANFKHHLAQAEDGFRLAFPVLGRDSKFLKALISKYPSGGT